MEVYLIRHTTPAVRKGFIYGRTDVALADTFEQEKDVIIKQLPLNIDAVFSSPSSRCTLLAAAISKDYIIDEALYELNFGCWEGKSWDTINRDESNFWMEDFINRCPPEGETMLQMEARVISCWNRLIRLQCQTAAIVSHGGVLRILSAYINKIPLQNAFTLNVGFGEIIKITT
jgi:alpha-ribazole phosphatase